jgi:hypothetical protein
MAVVQISKIQVRRGRKNAESGIPQLSSGELAWAVDSQELFIGNGSVADGAPYVGNSKVLTEHDNLLELIESYRWARSEPSITESVFRTIQAKLDDRVNVKDFGAVGDGVTDDTLAFQNALDQLFRNTSTEFRKQLFVPTGHYLIANTLRIPSYALIDGESQLGTIMIVNASTIETTSTLGTAIADFESSDRPSNIIVSNLTFRFTTGTVDITGLSSSTFRHVTFQGPLSTLSQAAAATSGTPMLTITNTNKVGTVVANVDFENCVFRNAYTAINFDQTNAYESILKFTNCEFKVLNLGVHIQGIVAQQNTWAINHCYFEQVARYAIWAEQGVGTKVVQTRFVNCGNDVNLASNPESAIVFFEEQGNNVVNDCSFNRHQQAYTTIQLADTRTAFPEVLNAGTVTITDQIKQSLYVSYTPTPLAMFSTLNRKTIIEYVVAFTSGSARTGTITITVGDNLVSPIITDSFSSTHGDTNAEALEFSIRLVDRNDSTAGSETMILDYKNPGAGVLPDTMTYFVTYGV